MIGPRDNLTLAVTKLRSRRIRLIVTLIVSGLLFTVLVAGSLVARGTLASIASFTKDGFSSRFIVQVYGLPSSSNYDPAIIKRTQAIEKDLLAKKVAEAKRLGIPYDQSSEPKATTEGGPSGPKQVGIDTTHPAAMQAIRELSPAVALSDVVRAAGKEYGLTTLYSGTGLAIYGLNPIELAPIVDGKETKDTKGQGPTDDSLASFAISSQTLDNSLLEPFVLKGTTLASSTGEAVPILAPMDAVEKLLGLKPLNTKATAAEKLARLKDIRTKASNFQFNVCYRNTEAIRLRELAKQQAIEAAASKGKPEYVAPAVQYATDAGACKPTNIIKDSRSAAEKKIAAKQAQFETTFGAHPPQTKLVPFRIVGILPHISYGSGALDISAIISGLMTSTLGTGWFISAQSAASHPVLSEILAQRALDPLGKDLIYAELPDRPSQKRFLDERSCGHESGPNTEIGPDGFPDPSIACRKDNKFFLSPFGNPMAALYDAQKGFLDFLRIVIVVIAGISAVIMMGTVGKIIADSRKETSVFRAVGAKRLDIAQVYLLYAAMLAALAFAISLAAGLAIAVFLDAKYSPGVSVAAVLAFNSPNADKAFHLIGINPLDMLGIFGFAVATGLISAVLPLLTNLRRNPIKDMREE